MGGTASHPSASFSRGDPRNSRHHKPSRPDCCAHKKPDPGKTEIGSHFVSFNFTNSLICGIASRHQMPLDFNAAEFPGAFSGKAEFDLPSENAMGLATAREEACEKAFKTSHSSRQGRGAILLAMEVRVPDFAGTSRGCASPTHGSGCNRFRAPRSALACHQSVTQTIFNCHKHLAGVKDHR